MRGPSSSAPRDSLCSIGSKGSTESRHLKCTCLPKSTFNSSRMNRAWERHSRYVHLGSRSTHAKIMRKYVTESLPTAERCRCDRVGSVPGSGWRPNSSSTCASVKRTESALAADNASFHWNIRRHIENNIEKSMSKESKGMAVSQVGNKQANAAT